MKSGFRRPRAIAKEVQLSKSHADEHGHPQTCLNCEAALVGAYCHVCGQSAHTHRMSFKHFLVHDVVHGIFHLDKGIIYTLRQVLTRPGKAARQYLAGRRVGYFNLLTLLLFLAAAYLFLEHRAPVNEDGVFKVNAPDAEGLFVFVAHNSRWIILCSCFVFSFSSFLLFRRARLNFTEYLILNGFFLAGILVINILEVAARLLFSGLNEGFLLLALVYIVWSYFGAFRFQYTLWGWGWRTAVQFLFSGVVIVGVVIGAIVFYTTFIAP